MCLPEALRRALHDAHDCAPAVELLGERFAALADADHAAEVRRRFPAVDTVTGVPGPEVRRIAQAVCAELAGEPHQLAKVMAALWRGPSLEHRLVAGLSADALGAVDMKRLLRFLQKAEKRLRDVPSCDVLAAGASTHICAHPDLFLREAENRLRAKQPLVRRSGVRILHVLEHDHAERVQAFLEACDKSVIAAASAAQSDREGFPQDVASLLWGDG